MSYPMWTDDPVKDAQAYQDYLDEPQEDDIICDNCGTNITKNCECYYEVCGDVYCDDCMEKRRVWIV